MIVCMTVCFLIAGVWSSMTVQVLATVIGGSPGFLFHCVLVSLGDLGIQEYISDCMYCVCFLIAKVWSSMTVQVLVTVIGGIMNYGV